MTTSTDYTVQVLAKGTFGAACWHCTVLVEGATRAAAIERFTELHGGAHDDAPRPKPTPWELIAQLPPLGGWAQHAACIGMAPMFDMTDHPNGEFHSDMPRLREAAQICRTCPVMLQCRTEGVTRKWPGVWGGVLITNHGRVIELGNRYANGEVGKAVPSESRRIA